MILGGRSKDSTPAEGKHYGLHLGVNIRGLSQRGLGIGPQGLGHTFGIAVGLTGTGSVTQAAGGPLRLR